MKYKVGDVVSSNYNNNKRYHDNKLIIVNIFETYYTFEYYEYKKCYGTTDSVIFERMTDLDVKYLRKLKLEKINDTSAMVK